MYKFEIKPILEKKIVKIFKRDKVTYEKIIKKIDEIINRTTLDCYKNLKHNMKDSKRVHIGHFVLIFSLKNNIISFEDFDHHDNIYNTQQKPI
jgi:YafQ family addiction module toxin component